ADVRHPRHAPHRRGHRDRHQSRQRLHPRLVGGAHGRRRGPSEGGVMAIPFKVNLRGLLVRKVSTISTAVCLALVVAVFSTMMALAEGLKHTFKISGVKLNVMVMRDGSTSEINSGVS